VLIRAALVETEARRVRRGRVRRGLENLASARQRHWQLCCAALSRGEKQIVDSVGRTDTAAVLASDYPAKRRLKASYRYRPRRGLRGHVVIGEVTAAAVLAFLREIVSPTDRHAGWQLPRVLTDNGNEFKGVFAAGCERCGFPLRAPNRARRGRTAHRAAAEDHPPRAMGASRCAHSTSRAAGRSRARLSALSALL
jgi:hypothetical protein